MFDAAVWPWAFAILIGFIVLGIAIGYGIGRANQRSRTERLASEDGTRKVYRDSDRKSGS